MSTSTFADSFYRSTMRALPPVRPPFAVSSPFLKPNGDVTLRSADGHDFRVVKAILKIASPFFQSLFSLPQPEGRSDVPTVPVSEDGCTLDILLRFCYPVKSTVVDDLGVAEKVLAAALKYEMEIVVQAMCRVLVSKKALETQPLRVYAITCQYELVEETRLAAIASLRAPIEDVYVKEFRTLPTVHYFNLLKFHRRVKAEICFVLRRATSTSPERYEYTVEDHREYPHDKVESIVYRCNDYRCRGGDSAAGWWKVLITEQVIAAVRSAPLRSELTDRYSFVKSKKAIDSCPSCETNMSGQWSAAIASLKDSFVKIATEIAEKTEF